MCEKMNEKMKNEQLRKNRNMSEREFLSLPRLNHSSWCGCRDIVALQEWQHKSASRDGWLYGICKLCGAEGIFAEKGSWAALSSEDEEEVMNDG